MLFSILSLLACTLGLGLEVEVQHDWLFIGDEPKILEVNVLGPAGTEVDVDFNLVTDISLMYGRDTVFRSSRTVLIGPDGRTATDFTFEGMGPGFYQVCMSAGDYVHPGFNIGIDPEMIVSPTDRQADFEEFWKRNLEELAAVPMDLKLTVDPEASNDIRTSYIVEATSLGGAKIGGYLCMPVKDGKYPVFLDYMGYGADCYRYDPSSRPDAIEFLVSVRDQGLFKEGNERWIDRGLSSKEEFYYRGAFCDVVRAIDIACSLDKADTSRIFARGESQGGAFSFVAAALDGRIRAAAPAVPFLGDYRDYSRIVSWPVWEVFETADKFGIGREDLFTTLSYFDIKNLAEMITCPIFMAFGLQDPTCPPHTNFSAYNQLHTDKHFYCAPLCGHAMWEVKEWSELRSGWFETFR